MQLNYREMGTGQTVLVMHGLFGSLSNWNSIARKLADQFHMVLIDLRNHGDSPHSDEMSYELMKDDVISLIRQLSDQPCHLVGHSMGGKVAMKLAMNAPELVRSLVAVDIAPVVYDNHFGPFVDAMQALDLDSVKNRQDADQQLSAHIPHPGVRAFLLQNLRQKDDRWYWRNNLNAIANRISRLSAFTDENDSSYSGPTLFLRGTQSDYVTDPPQPEIQQYFPNAEIHAIEGAGHWVHAEKPQEVIQQIRSFLAN